MKSLKIIIEETFKEYLQGINTPIKTDMKISELIELTIKYNGSNPYSAVGKITEQAVKIFEEQ